MAKFHPLKIQSLKKETDHCTVITFDVPQELKDNFSYKSGQHLTLKHQINGNEVRRSYSLCSSPLENKWQVAVKQIPNGVFSTYANTSLEENEYLDVMPPSGLFGVQPNQSAANNYVFFAAGSGITPIISMIKSHLALEPNSTCQLFYLNKNSKSIIFKEELEQIRNKYFGRLEISYFLTREQRDIELFNGRFTPEKIDILCKTLLNVDNIDECFICGPEEMIFMISKELENRGLNKEHIHFELFYTGASEVKKTEPIVKDTRKEDLIAITILDGGKEFHFDMDEKYDNVLDAALEAGIDLPFACKGGVCSTCKCKLISGNIEMKINYSLEKEELDQNFILSCQAKPTTNDLVLDFDV